jgi:hypothetical protein
MVIAVWKVSPTAALAGRLPARLPAVTPAPPVARGGTIWP